MTMDLDSFDSFLGTLFPMLADIETRTLSFAQMVAK